jgi:hypothetical protein
MMNMNDEKLWEMEMKEKAVGQRTRTKENVTAKMISLFVHNNVMRKE